MPTKNELIQVFDDNVINYSKYRPKYPRELVDDIIQLSKIQSNGKILEIGCGTGKITFPFAKQGYKITGLEKGSSLAEFTIMSLKNFLKVDIKNISFEDWEPESERYDIVLSAQAFHWIEPDYGLVKANQILYKNGSLCLIWNLDRSNTTQFWKLTNPIYEKYLPSNKSNKSLDNFVRIYEKKINAMDIFEMVQLKSYKWEKKYQKEEYLGLLKTFSDHMTLEESKRVEFFSEIEKIIDLTGNIVKRKYETVLLFSRKSKLS
ncbi:MAG: class I SAM-dependent methyltransferase [Candidatus Cloacimonetes bacterium]|nr:class I SAM-dependent methyltransferase [Candidatus Cloacimonadota bacterium]